MIVNKESSTDLQLSIDCGRMVSTADLWVMSGPSLDASGGVSIQGASVTNSGGFAPAPPYTAQVSGSTVTCYLNALSAALVHVT